MLKLDKVCKFIGFVIISLYLSSCSKKDVSANEAELKMKLELEQMKAKQKALEAKLAKEESEKKAEKEAKEAVAKAEALEAKLAAEREMAEKKLAEKLAIEAEKERVKQEKIKARQLTQKAAHSKYVKTTYESLTLLDGKVLKKVVVTAANPEKVSLMHYGGVKNVKYSNLPKEIGEACLYDEELEQIYLAEKAIATANQNERDKKRVEMQKAEKLAKAEAKAAKLAKARQYGARESSKKAAPVKPKGQLRVKVVATRKGSKTIELVAKSNVDAILVLNDWIYHRTHRFQVTAGQVYNHTWNRVSNKYEVQLLAKEGKAVLAKETWNRKSGLGR